MKKKIKMKKKLIRDYDNQEGSINLSTDEFFTCICEQIADNSSVLKDSTETGKTLEILSDTMELIYSVLQIKNIKPDVLFDTINELKRTKGTFSSKKAVQQESENE